MKFSIKKTTNSITELILPLSLLAVTDISTAFSAEDIDSSAEAQFIAKAPKNAAFDVLDINGDKKVTFGEAKKDYRLIKFFEVSDVNHDHFITVDEYAQYKSKQSSVYLMN